MANTQYSRALGETDDWIDGKFGSHNGGTATSRTLDGPFTNGLSGDDSKLAAGPHAAPSIGEERRMSFTSSFSRFPRELSLSRETLLGPKRPRPHKIWKKKFIKLLVVGDSGLGKTTLIRTLLSTPGERLQLHDGTSTSPEQFDRDPESLCSTVTWNDEEDRVIWVYRIQDTPGYGNLENLDILEHINKTLAYIEKQNYGWLQLENARDRKEDLADVEDPRVDICLYCLPPHRLRPVDLRYMYELGRVVPIIPVITKADTMTIKEAAVYRQEVYNRLQNPNLQNLTERINVFPFDKDTLERAGIRDSLSGTNFPFLLVASNDINEEFNRADPPVFWPERRYPWGTAEAFNPEHSDLLQLRALLLKEALENIAKSKRYRYEEWRRQVLSNLKLGQRVRRLLLWTIVPVALALHAGANHFKLSDIGRVANKGVRVVKKVLAEEEEPRVEAPPPPPPAPVAAPPPPPVVEEYFPPPPPPSAPKVDPSKKSWF